MGISSQASSEMSTSYYRTHKLFLLSNYILLDAASSYIFLTLSLHLIPSAIGFLVILLHALTIVGVVSGCAAANSSSDKWHGAHMVATVLTAILQGSVAVLVLTRTSEFLLRGLRSYVSGDDGAIILRMVGGLGVVIFSLEWVALALAFVLSIMPMWMEIAQEEILRCIVRRRLRTVHGLSRFSLFMQPSGSALFLGIELLFT